MKQVDIMMARKIRQLAEGDVKFTQPEIATILGVSERTVRNVLKGNHDAHLDEQRAIADRMEHFVGGVLGPNQGNYRSYAEHHGDSDTSYSDIENLGHGSMADADPLDILLAEEELERRLDND